MRRYRRSLGVALAEIPLEEYLVGASMPRRRENCVTRFYLPARGGAV
ncbi:MAG: hypothetical protein SOY64_03120 [Pyramidobacter sp.]|nr:hypothetical protein [Pyramidobacter sp.]